MSERFGPAPGNARFVASNVWNFSSAMESVFRGQDHFGVGLENWLTTYLGFHGIGDKTLFMSFVMHLTDLLPRG